MSAIEDDPPPYLFGHALFDPHYVDTPLDAGSSYYILPIHFATLNLEHSGDLFGLNPLLFHPDLVTGGRQVFISSLYQGPQGSRAYWRGRPFRDVRTGRSDLSLLPLAGIGGARAELWGGLNGAVSPGAVIDFQPLELESSVPLTYLTHRDGFYGFEPVEFVHSRQVGSRSFLTAGGLIPASRGRFSHAEYTGHILYGELSWTLNGSDKLSFAYLSNINKTNIPFSTDRYKTDRSDLDIGYTFHKGKSTRIAANAYHTESMTKLGVLDDYGREVGFDLRIIKETCGGYIRFSRLDGRLAGVSDFNLTEFEGSIGWHRRFGFLDLRALVGGYGWYPERIRTVLALGAEADIQPLGEIFIQFKQSPEPHSPEMMFAEYSSDRPHDDFNPAWTAYPDRPIIGAKKPVTINRSGRTGIRRDIGFGEIEIAGFSSIDVNPVIWNVKYDSVEYDSIKYDSYITLIDLKRRYCYGWTASWLYRENPFHATLSLVGTDHNEESSTVVPITYREPIFKLVWEIGWHRSFWENQFETDISLSGKYYGSFYAYGDNDWEKLGGAYPVDFRLTFRIRRFTFYWGLHNLNSYQYSLVPGYKMIHREEYWGVNWLLLH